MGRFVGFLAVAAVFGMLLLGNSSAAHAEGNCQAKLVGKAYNCVLISKSGAKNTYCTEFETGGVSADFDAYFGSADFGCTCDASGSVTSPSFDSSSKSFECVQDVSEASLVTGKIDGKTLAIQGTDAFGDSLFGSCKEISTSCK
jgi:hypothetical protein